MMKDYENYNGVFVSSDSNLSGHLRIAGADSSATIVGPKYWEPKSPKSADIHGLLSGGAKASLLQCALLRTSRHTRNREVQFESRIFPSFVVVGDEFVRSNEPEIRAVRYHFSNVSYLVSGAKTFQSLSPTPSNARILLKQEHDEMKKIWDEHGLPEREFDPEIGEQPQLLYFSGLHNITSFDVNLARISLTNKTSYGMGNSKGIDFKNEVVANIEFFEPKTLDSALHALRTLHGFFELCLGERQRFCWIELELIHRRENVEGRPYHTARLYWSLGNKRVDHDSDDSLGDILLEPDRQPEEFSAVVTGWMNSVEDMGDPRERFATAFFGRYGINRLVGAANMFDLLPEGRAPAKVKLDDELEAAVKQSRETFKALGESSARQSVLSALGRVGHASLRDKVYHLADNIFPYVGGKCPDLKIPCHHAVLARNHYVHGSPASFDYQKNLAELAFITDTLEFIFATSDLLDLGWNMNRWLTGFHSVSHPFSNYIMGYKDNIERLKKLVAK